MFEGQDSRLTLKGGSFLLCSFIIFLMYCVWFQWSPVLPHLSACCLEKLPYSLWHGGTQLAMLPELKTFHRNSSGCSSPRSCSVSWLGEWYKWCAAVYSKNYVFSFRHLFYHTSLARHTLINWISWLMNVVKTSASHTFENFIVRGILNQRSARNNPILDENTFDSSR